MCGRVNRVHRVLVLLLPLFLPQIQFLLARVSKVVLYLLLVKYVLIVGSSHTRVLLSFE